MPVVYIIVINYQKWGDTIQCLEALLRSTYKQFRIVMIDNHSDNGSVAAISDWCEKRMNTEPFDFKKIHEEELELCGGKNFSRVTIVQNRSNKGFAGAINSVVNVLRSEDVYIWLLNPDMVIEETALNALVNFATAKPRRTITGCVVRYQSDREKIHFYGGGYINFRSGTVKLINDRKDFDRLDYISGGSLFTHADSFNEIGLLPEHYFLYWEETDWCYRAKSSGYALAVCEAAVCFDKVSSTIGKGFLADYYYTRNGLHFLASFHRESFQTVFLFTFLRMIKRLLSGQISRARGVFAGIRGFLNNTVHAYK